MAKINSALVATPDVHQSVFLRVIAHYTYACFIPVIVSGPYAWAVTVSLRSSCFANYDGGHWGCGQAIYPVLIVVIVALNRSPIERGLSYGGGSSVGATPTHLDLHFRAATTTTATTMTSTVEITGSAQMQGVQDEEDGAADTKVKEGTMAVV